MKLRRILPMALVAASCAHAATPPQTEPVVAVTPAAVPAAAGAVVPEVRATPAAPAKVLPFDPSPEDTASLGAMGFTGTAKVLLPDGSSAMGPRIADVKPGSGLDACGARKGDVIVSIAGTFLRDGDADPIGRLRGVLRGLAPETEVDLAWWRDGTGLMTARALLGRQPPPFARIDTPAAWLAPTSGNRAVADLIRSALELDGGEARFADTLERNRRHSAKRDVFRLREVTEAHMDLAANEPLAVDVASAVARDPVEAARIAAGLRSEAPPRADVPEIPATDDVEAIVTAIAAGLAAIDADVRAATASWSDDDRRTLADGFPRLTERIIAGEYIYDDEDPLRERTNRRVVAVLAKTDRVRLASAASKARALADAATVRLRAALTAGPVKPGLVASRDTPAGRIEVWGSGSQRHTTQCAFLFDLEGDDNYLDVAGRADLGRDVSIFIDASGSDLWAATSPFGLAGALGGVSLVADLAGDDQYLSRDWSQGAAVAGFALLMDAAGRDVYHAQCLSQGIGLMGAGVVSDRGGADLYTGARFCQGVGLPGGVGAATDRSGDDRWVCTGRFDSEYGEPGLFSGWGQGCGFGFRLIASGGIGVLFDEQGDDVYEAGNFSQGGGYFYAWGILWDGRGRDRYMGSRYAQGFAAHQAAGTFLEGAGDDVYQSHSGVAQGLSWDETSVVFHDMAGDDTYGTTGFSLGSAAHNGMVLFLDDSGNDRYAGLPAHAKSNDYHGGRSFALFVDGAGDDVYEGEDAHAWNDRSAVRDEGAYHVDLPPGGGAPKRFLR